MLGFLNKGAAKDLGNRVAGKTDILEAGAALGALVAGADGNIGDDEQAACVKALKTNSVVTAAFQSFAIETAVAKEFDKADGGSRSGKLALWKEIDDVAARGDRAICEFVLVTGMDVADKGGRDAAETAVLEKAAAKFGLKLADYEV